MLTVNLNVKTDGKVDGVAKWCALCPIESLKWSSDPPWSLPYSILSFISLIKSN